MVVYNPKDWFRFVFTLHKADTITKLGPLLLGICIYSGLVAYLELEYWKLSSNSYIKNITVMHTLLSLAISILLVFRTNTAYDRWWEGRKLWGNLVNNSRNFAMKMSVILDPEDRAQRTFFRKAIAAYAFTLHHHLRREETRTMLEDDEHGSVLRSIDRNKHIPNQVALLMYKHVQHLYNDKKLTGEQLLYLKENLETFSEICGACERIKNTPIPFSYSVFIKKFIFIYVITLPLGYVFSLGYFVIPVVAFIFFVLASLELIAEEIEDPFGGDQNDVPTDVIAKNIERQVSELI